MPRPEKLSIGVETLTPIWTGDADRRTTYIRATSILGGLRFWTEALLRSFGQELCDITNTGSDGKPRCLLNSQNAGLCACCDIFGCTGLSRSFALKVRGDGQEKVHAISYRRNGQISRQESKGRNDAVRIELVPLRPARRAEVGAGGQLQLDPTLCLAATLMLGWGTLGAKDQYGHGLVRATKPEKLLELATRRLATAVEGAERTPDRADFRDFFFFQGQLADARSPWDRADRQFGIRAGIRNSLRHDIELRHYFCGNMQGRKIGTKYNFGITDNNRLFGWGWFPRKGTHDSHRDLCLDNVKKVLSSHLSDVRWKEFYSSRDTCGSSQDWRSYLDDMVSRDWR